MEALILAIIWFGFGLLAYGLFLGGIQGKYPLIKSKADVIPAILTFIMGPIGLLAVCVNLCLFNAWGYGLKFIPEGSR